MRLFKKDYNERIKRLKLKQERQDEKIKKRKKPTVEDLEDLKKKIIEEVERSLDKRLGLIEEKHKTIEDEEVIEKGIRKESRKEPMKEPTKLEARNWVLDNPFECDYPGCKFGSGGRPFRAKHRGAVNLHKYNYHDIKAKDKGKGEKVIEEVEDEIYKAIKRKETTDIKGKKNQGRPRKEISSTQYYTLNAIKSGSTDIILIGKGLGLSPMTIKDRCYKLKKLGLINFRGDQAIKLTQKGIMALKEEQDRRKEETSEFGLDDIELNTIQYNILKLIKPDAWEIASEIAKRLNRRPRTIRKQYYILKRYGLIETISNKGIRITQKGMEFLKRDKPKKKKNKFEQGFINLTPMEHNILESIRLGRVTPTELVKTLGVNPSTIKYHCNLLRGHKLIIARRNKGVKITQKDMELLKRPGKECKATDCNQSVIIDSDYCQRHLNKYIKSLKKRCEEISEKDDLFNYKELGEEAKDKRKAGLPGYERGY